MEKLYYSKGVSKSVFIGSVISIIVGILVGIYLIVESGATVTGATQTFSLGGTIHHYTPEHMKYTSEGQDALMSAGFIFIILSILEIGILVLRMRSWVEIYQDSIRANTMGKDITCKIADLTSVTFNKFAGMLSLEGPAGKIKLVFKEPESAQNIIKNLMYNKVSTPGNSQQTAPQAVYSAGTNSDDLL